MIGLTLIYGTAVAGARAGIEDADEEVDRSFAHNIRFLNREL